MAHRKKVLAVAALAATMSLAVMAYAGDASSSTGMGIDNLYATAELYVSTKSITAKTIASGMGGTVTVSARGFAYNDQNPGEIVTLSSGTVSNPEEASVVLSKTGYSIYATATSYHTFTYKGRTVDKSLSAKP